MEDLIWIVIILVAIIQIIMIVKFFEMASDIKDIRNMMLRVTREEKATETDGNSEAKPIAQENKDKGDSAKFTWQSWVAIIIIIIGIIIYLSSK